MSPLSKSHFSEPIATDAARPNYIADMSSDIIRLVVDDLNTAIVIFTQAPLHSNQPEITFSNAALRTLTGYAESEFSICLVTGLFSDFTSPRDALTIEHHLRRNEPVQQLEVQLQRKDATPFWASLSIVQTEGYAGAWVMVLRDISPRKWAEERLARENQRLAVTLRSIGDGVITVDTQGLVEFINRQGENVTGYRQADIAGKPLGQVFYTIDEKTRKPLENPLTKVFKTAKPVEFKDHVLLINADGEERKVRGNLAPIIDPQDRIIGAVLAFSDISIASKLEQEIQKSQRMESISLLAGGIAHDFNNILTGIMGNLSMASNQCSPDNPLVHFLKSAEKASIRAKDLTYQLLTFSKGGVPTKEKACIRTLLSEAAGFILSGSKCRLRSFLPNNLWAVMVDEGQISQVISNIIINAVHAMPEGGELVIRAENVIVGGEPSLPLEPGSFCKITITDEGVGISVDDMVKIFDPYFSTKKCGTGLGLATSYSIIKNHGGHIEVDSEVGTGSMFTLYLPALQNEVDVPQCQDAMIHRGSGRILVMDDEVMIQQIVGDMLKHLGYTVDFAENGSDAIEKFKAALATSTPFDVLILDMTVPGGDGAKEVIDSLLPNHPNLKAVLSSGYIDNPMMKAYRNHGFKGTITKPFNIAEISWVLKSVITAGKEAY